MHNNKYIPYNLYKYSMRVRFIGPVPAHNGDLGYVEPEKVYSVPEGREQAFKNSGDFEVLEKDEPKKKSTSFKDG